MAKPKEWTVSVRVFKPGAVKPYNERTEDDLYPIDPEAPYGLPASTRAKIAAAFIEVHSRSSLRQVE